MVCPYETHRASWFLLHPEQAPPDSIKGYSEQDMLAFKTGYDVVNTLRKARHEVRVLGVQHELRPIRAEIDSYQAGHRFQPAGGIPRRARPMTRMSRAIWN